MWMLLLSLKCVEITCSNPCAKQISPNRKYLIFEILHDSPLHQDTFGGRICGIRIGRDMWAMASFWSCCNSLHLPMYGSLRSAIVAHDRI